MKKEKSVYILAVSNDYEGYDCPSEYFKTYKGAFTRLQNVAKCLRRKIKNDSLRYKGGTIEIAGLSPAPTETLDVSA